MNVPALVLPEISSGDGLVNAKALDAVIAKICNKLNAVIVGLGESRSGDQLADSSVRWRMFSDDAKQVLKDMVAQLAEIRRQLPDPSIQVPVPQIGNPQYILSSATYAYAIDPAAPRTVEKSFILPGDNRRAYRISIRIRHYAERCFVGCPTLDISSPYYPNLNGDQMEVGQVDAGRAWGDALWNGKVMNPTPPNRVKFDNSEGIVWSKCTEPLIVGAYPTDFYKITVSDTIQLIPAAWFATGTFEAFYATRKLDRVFDIIVFGEKFVNILRDNLNGKSAFTLRSDYPEDNDPRFPYLARLRDASAFQLDVVGFEPVLPNFNHWVVDDLGAPIVLTPGGYWTTNDSIPPIVDTCVGCDIYDVYRTGGLSGTIYAGCSPVLIGTIQNDVDFVSVPWSGDDPAYCSVEVTVRSRAGINRIKQCRAVVGNSVSITITYDDVMAAVEAGVALADNSMPCGPEWCPTFALFDAYCVSDYTNSAIDGAWSTPVHVGNRLVSTLPGNIDTWVLSGDGAIGTFTSAAGTGDFNGSSSFPCSTVPALPNPLTPPSSGPSDSQLLAATLTGSFTPGGSAAPNSVFCNTLRNGGVRTVTNAPCVRTGTPGNYVYKWNGGGEIGNLSNSIGVTYVQATQTWSISTVVFPNSAFKTNQNAGIAIVGGRLTGTINHVNVSEPCPNVTGTWVLA